MQTASFMGVLKTLFYILAFYYIFKFLAKLLLPLIVKKVVQKAGENFQQQQSQSQGTSWKNAQDGDEGMYNSSDSKKPRETKKVGDYVDYEEID